MTLSPAALDLTAWRAAAGQWSTAAGGASLRGNGDEWSVLEGGATKPNDLITANLSGTAALAGFSFGDDNDFLVPVDPSLSERSIQLELDGEACRFRADGTLVETRAAGDRGPLALKAWKAEEVRFARVTTAAFASPPRVSVVMTCYRFAQRLRVALTSWCRQRLPAGALEIIVANPESPDGTHELIASMAAAYPEVRLYEIAVAGGLARNKGYMLNRAMQECRGEWIWLTDADCVFPPDAAARLLACDAPAVSLLYCERRHLSKAATDLLLAGRADAAGDFAAFAGEADATEAFPWGYSQILHRSQIPRIRYREDVDHFAGSDGSFLEECRRGGLRERQIEGLACLHLRHPFAWYGTKLFL
ncbi:MAG TPA: glycosyltransferase family 2 protein [Thermoanaerobaculia bacterium]|jgi:hypothetical protein